MTLTLGNDPVRLILNDSKAAAHSALCNRSVGVEQGNLLTTRSRGEGVLDQCQWPSDVPLLSVLPAREKGKAEEVSRRYGVHLLMS